MKRIRAGFKPLSPTQLVAIGFLALIFSGVVLLMLPFSSADHTSTPFLKALFTATSAVSLTGLTVVDTGSHWSTSGKVIVACLIQLGGFGIMSLTSLAGMILTGRLSLKSRMNAAAEGRTLSVGGVRRTLIATLTLSAVCELILAMILTSRFAHRYGMPIKTAIGEGIFHSISAFNNAGFGLRKDNLVPYMGDAWIILPIAGALMIGGLGFPVLQEFIVRVKSRFLSPRGKRTRLGKLSVTTHVTLIGTVILVLGGWIAVALLEWNKAMSGLTTGQKVLSSFFQAVTPRTAGFNTLDYGTFHPSTLFITDILMFIGGGSAGTAGGVKITTITILLAAMVAEFRGEGDTIIGRRTISQSVLRQAMTVFALGITLVAFGTMALMLLESSFSGSQILFEVTSAFGTVGLSTGITASLSAPSQAILCFIMYLGRIGPVTLVTALAGKNKVRRFAYPEERPFIG